MTQQQHTLLHSTHDNAASKVPASVSTAEHPTDDIYVLLLRVFGVASCGNAEHRELFCFPENAVTQQRCGAMAAKAYLWSHYLPFNLFRISGIPSSCDVQQELFRVSLRRHDAQLWSLLQHAPGAHRLNLFISEQMKTATLQNRDWIMLNTLKPHRHKQEQLEKKGLNGIN